MVSLLNFQVDVVVQFHPWFRFCFLLFLGIVMYHNEFESLKKIKYEPRIKLNHNKDTINKCFHIISGL